MRVWEYRTDHSDDDATSAHSISTTDSSYYYSLDSIHESPQPLPLTTTQSYVVHRVRSLVILVSASADALVLMY